MREQAARPVRGALILAIVVLPWVVASQAGIGGVGTSPTVPETTTAIETLTSVLVVASDRPTVSTSLKRTDGPRVLAAAPAGRSIVLHPPGLVPIAWSSGRIEGSRPLALHLAGRGPPLLVST